MKQQSTKCVVDEWGNLVNAEDFRFPSFWKLYCFHCTSPMIYVCADESQKEHFLHDLTSLTYQAADICSYLISD